MIKIDKISKSYGSKSVLKDLSLNLNRGKVHGIVGENGAGKTTLFRCLAGLEAFDGEIKSDVQPLKNHIGLLPTNPIFMSKITGWEYLKLLSVSRNIKEEQFEEKNIFELDLNQFVETYSTGMKKKLALLGVLLQNNEVFVLDEPFNGVDIHSNIIIAEIILKLKSLNKVVIISSHIFSILSETCDEIFVLENGTFKEQVCKENFHLLDEKMRKFAVGNRIDKLKLH
jgi:ABC-2 type transport system ATP-binding protein